MARTPLFQTIRRALRRAHVAARLGERPEALEAEVARGLSRRQVLAAAAIVPLAAACRRPAAGQPRPGGAGAGQPRIAIVGGGIAGLHCAYRLREAGVTATIYEASSRTGGRMFTARDQLAGGQLCELGGELIDTGHAVMRGLAAELGIALDDLAAEAQGLEKETFYFDGRHLEMRELVELFRPVAAKIGAAAAASDTGKGELARLDAMSMADWLRREAGLDPDALMWRILEIAYLTEYGLPIAEQSCMNLHWLIDHAKPDPFRVFGDSDVRFHVHAGNDAITTALAKRVEDRLVLGHALARVARAGNGYTLRFHDGRGDVEVTADHVVLALPFTRLRAVDLDGLDLPPERRRMIAELGYGTNAKLMLQFASRPWRAGGRTGSSISDVGDLETTWDTSRGQAGAEGILTNYVGGARGLAIGEGSAEERARELLPWLDAVFPGTAAAYLPGRAVRMHWPTHPHTLGSFACFRPGQAAWYDALGGRIDRLHFAGEHTSEEHQGYMEGAAETGARAAREILEDLGLARPAPAGVSAAGG